MATASHTEPLCDGFECSEIGFYIISRLSRRYCPKCLDRYYYDCARRAATKPTEEKPPDNILKFPERRPTNT